jgi:membrane AbrB-like protein
MLGILFTYDTLMQMMKMLPAMFTTTILLIGFSVLLAFYLVKLTGIAFKTVISGFTPFTLPEVLLIASQLLLGIHMGMMVDPKRLTNLKRYGSGAIFSCIILIISSISLAVILMWLFPIGLGTAFLSTAPGGIAEMGLTAQAIGADLSIVTGFQLFRIFFILFLVPPMVMWVFRRRRAYSK